MNAHVLLARCPDGTMLEIGTIGQLETACRLRHALEEELGDEYVGFSLVELEQAVTCRGLTYDELRPPLPDARAEVPAPRLAYSSGR